LDVSIQAQIINLLIELRKENDLSLIFISHDLSIVRVISHRVMVLYMGRVVESAPRKKLFGEPSHPYTQALLLAAPIADPKRERGKKRALLEGDMPSPLNPPSGCVFRTRCPKAWTLCSETAPAAVSVSPDHLVSCHLFKPGISMQR
jgi:oligopeptide transport system ATP-binding protein